jgi:hypothetical protein
VTLFVWGFEGQTDGVPPTIANSSTFGDPAWTVVSAAGFLTYSTAQAFLGTVGLKVDVTTAATACNLDKADTASANAAAHTYIYLTAYPSTDVQAPISFRGGANLAHVRITATGQVRNVVGSTVGTASTSVLALNTWYRLELVTTGHNSAAAALNSNVYVGNSTTPFFTPPAVTGVTTAALVDTVRYTKFGGTTLITFWLDDPRQDIGATAELGPTLTAGFPPQPVRAGRRVAPPRRARMEVVQPPPDLMVPPAFRGPRRQFRPVRRGVEVVVPPAQVVVPPARTPNRQRARRFAVLARRGVEQTFVPPVAAPVAPVKVPAVVFGRRQGRLLRRPQVVGPVPGQVVPVAPTFVPGSPHPRRVGAWLRRRGGATPVPPQAAAPVAPVVAPPGPRVRRVQALLRRRPPAVVVPVQVAAPANPAYPPAGPRGRRLVVLLRRNRLTTNLPVVPDQAVPPALPQRGRRRPAVPLDRQRTPVGPPPAQAPAVPVVPRRPVRARLQALFRRGARRQSWPVQPGNANPTLPRPGTILPGARGGPGVGPGTRTGPGGGPGVRGSATGAPGVRRGSDNEPGTRSGPTISGGQ